MRREYEKKTGEKKKVLDIDECDDIELRWSKDENVYSVL
jgi:hypothetical protein